jgi:hypothetical protein
MKARVSVDVTWDVREMESKKVREGLVGLARRLSIEEDERPLRIA